MISLTTAEGALKTLYLGVLTEQLNTKVNPLYNKIGTTTNDVYGKEIRKVATYGINGGIGAGTETGSLPTAGGNNYVQFVMTLKNLFGKIEISDKALRASADNSGAFVNLLNAEMEGLVKASKFNLGRMLFGDGTGQLCKITESGGELEKFVFKVDKPRALYDGMVIDIYQNGGLATVGKNRRVKKVDYDTGYVTLDFPTLGVAFAVDSEIYVQNSKDNEITGLEAIFGDSENLYGLKRDDYKFLQPYINSDGGAITPEMIQDAVDYVEENSGVLTDFIVTSYAVRKKYVAFCQEKNTNIDIMNLDGGYRAISYSGIPIVADRFCEKGTMYLLTTDDFRMHQLCDWRWLEGQNGSILRQAESSPTYTATLVKYADMLCDRPAGQAKITNITVA